jgi:hypothetical protein
MRCNKSALDESETLKHRGVFKRAHSPHLSINPRLSSLYQELQYTGRRELAAEGSMLPSGLYASSLEGAAPWQPRINFQIDLEH